MRSIICTINGSNYKLDYSAQIRKTTIEFSGRLHVKPSLQFKYMYWIKPDESIIFEKADLDKIICERVSVILK